MFMPVQEDFFKLDTYKYTNFLTCTGFVYSQMSVHDSDGVGVSKPTVAGFIASYPLPPPSTLS